MSRFTVSIGDLYDDGHGKYENLQVDVPNYDRDTLRQNYSKNIKELNFNPESLCDQYEKSSEPIETFLPLLELGFDFSEESNSGITWSIERGEDQIYLGVRAFVELLMFFYGYGLDDFSYTFVEEPELLNENTCIGYGIFY